MSTILGSYLQILVTKNSYLNLKRAIAALASINYTNPIGQRETGLIITYRTMTFFLDHSIEIKSDEIFEFTWVRLFFKLALAVLFKPGCVYILKLLAQVHHFEISHNAVPNEDSFAEAA